MCCVCQKWYTYIHRYTHVIIDSNLWWRLLISDVVHHVVPITAHDTAAWVACVFCTEHAFSCLRPAWPYFNLNSDYNGVSTKSSHQSSLALKTWSCRHFQFPLNSPEIACFCSCFFNDPPRVPGSPMVTARRLLPGLGSRQGALEDDVVPLWWPYWFDGGSI